MAMANPATRDEVLRNHDRQLANLESIPGGQAALQRAFNEMGDMEGSLYFLFQHMSFLPLTLYEKNRRDV
jgi:hypothetical protein